MLLALRISVSLLQASNITLPANGCSTSAIFDSSISLSAPCTKAKRIGLAAANSPAIKALEEEMANREFIVFKHQAGLSPEELIDCCKWWGGREIHSSHGIRYEYDTGDLLFIDNGDVAHRAGLPIALTGHVTPHLKTRNHWF